MATQVKTKKSSAKKPLTRKQIAAAQAETARQILAKKEERARIRAKAKEIREAEIKQKADEEAAKLLEVTSQTATVPLHDFYELLTGVLICAGKDDSIPSLCAVHIGASQSQFFAESTDRYRLLRGVIGTKTAITTGDLRDTLINRSDIDAVMVMLKRWLKSPLPYLMVTISRLGDEVTVRVRDEGVIFARLDGKFPLSAHLFRDREVDAVEGVSLNARYLNDFAKVPSESGPDQVSMTFKKPKDAKPGQSGSSSPIIITIEHHSIEWQALLMPMRHAS